MTLAMTPMKDDACIAAASTDEAQLQPGVLAVDEAPADQQVHRVRVEMLTGHDPAHLVGHADNIGTGWFDASSGRLVLQFHLVQLFSNAAVAEFWLSIPGTAEKIPLSPACITSPLIGQQHPDIPWSMHSRFVVDEVIDLPDWATGATRMELVAGVAGEAKVLGAIHVLEKGAVVDPAYPTEAPAGTVVSLGTGEEIARMLPSVAKMRSLIIPMTHTIILPYASTVVERIKGMKRLFLLTVVIPTVISVIYFGLIASDVYVSESRFVVRSAEQQMASPLGMLFKSVGFSRSQDDTYTVQDFMLSRDALRLLDERLGVAKAYASKDVDVVSRFAGLSWDDSFEALFSYYQKKVDVHFDSMSSITTLTVRSFTAEDAFRINQQLLDMGDVLVNQLNERGRQDMIRFATAEVLQAEKNAKNAALALSNYRNQKGVFDPERQAPIQLQQISKLQDELIATQSQLSQLLVFAQGNPQVPTLRQRIQTLQREIDAETKRMAGGERSLARKDAEYQRIALDREFADKQLGSALASLEQARNEAQRKQFYLERIVQPSKPDEAMEPRRVRNILATLIFGLVLWGVISVVVAGIREHQG